MYPVGYHVDNFKNGDSSLENKICMISKEREGYGRGGGSGKRYFTWALLDWTNDISGQRRRIYRSLGGTKNRVTKSVWEEFAKQNKFDPNII